MIPLLMGASLRPYLYLALAAALVAALGASYLRGRTDGRAAEAVACQAHELERQQQDVRERANLQRAIEVRDAEIRERQQQAATAVEQVRVEYLPAKTIVKREVVERPVYRECRTGDSLRDTLNAALRGAPAANSAEHRGPDGLSG